jgi:predicted DNA-binding transcriptional regulator AlpA
LFFTDQPGADSFLLSVSFPNPMSRPPEIGHNTLQDRLFHQDSNGFPQLSLTSPELFQILPAAIVDVIPRNGARHCSGGLHMSKQYGTAFLPQEGFVRLPVVLAVLGIGRTSWWCGIRDGRYPKAVKLGARTSVWRVEDIRALIASFADSSQDSLHQKKKGEDNE